MPKQPSISDVDKRPDVQYVLAFIGGLVAFFISGFVTSLVPITALFPPPLISTASSEQILVTNVALNAFGAIILAILMGLLFVTFARGLKALGAKKIKPQAVWLGAMLAGLWVLVGITGSDLLSVTTYQSITPNNLVIVDGLTVVVLSLAFVSGWWLARRKSSLK